MDPRIGRYFLVYCDESLREAMARCPDGQRYCDDCIEEANRLDPNTPYKVVRLIDELSPFGSVVYEKGDPI